MRSLYREILRGLTKAKKVPAKFEGSSCPDLQKEYHKASLNPSLYKQHLLSEAKNYAYEEFSKPSSRVLDHRLHLKLVEGYSLVRALEEMKVAPGNEPWSPLMSFVASQRAKTLTKAHQRETHNKFKDEIDASITKDLRPLEAKRLTSQLQRKQRKTPPFHTLSPVEKYDVYKKQIARSKDNAHDLVKRYLKKLQVRGEIPQPYKLPYVPTSLQQQLPDLPKSSIILPGSTKDAVLKQAYDSEYIESIIKPEIEHMINDEKMRELEHIVTTKGPYPVTVRTTRAGLMPVNFLRLPYKDLKTMKGVAMDIKYSMRAVRKSFIWNLDAEQMKTVPEKKVGEGYSVRGSGGHSEDEIMYPRSYYEDLAHEEAWWEFLMEVESLKQTHGDALAKPHIHAKLEKVYREIDHEWQLPLQTTTEVLEQEIRSYYSKHQLTQNHPIWKRQNDLQLEMNSKFAKTVADYRKLLEALAAHNVDKHSNLFHCEEVQTYEQQISKQDQLPRKIRKGVAETETGGLTLGSLMEKAGFKAYKMGQEFKKRLNFQKHKS